MRYSRQNKVLELINEHEIETQEKLCQLLKESGYDVTQATVSRDIKELQLIKTLSSSGKYKYVQSISSGPVSDRFVKIFKETIKSVTPAENIIVIHTLAGCANAAGQAVDSMNIPGIVGTVAGDDTIMMVAESREVVPTLIETFHKLLK